jgi:hypothetical protein
MLFKDKTVTAIFGTFRFSALSHFTFVFLVFLSLQSTASQRVIQHYMPDSDVYILAFLNEYQTDKNQPHQIALQISLGWREGDKEERLVLTSNRNKWDDVYILPQGLVLPHTLTKNNREIEGLEQDSTSEMRHILFTQGFFVFRSTNPQNESTLYVFDLVRSIKSNSVIKYRIPELPLTKGFSKRHYAFARLDMRDLESPLTTDLLVSMVDVNEKGEMHSLGTLLYDTAAYTVLSDKWTDFTAIGSQFSINRNEPIDEELKKYRISADGREIFSFNPIKSTGVKSYPGAKDSAVNMTGLFQSTKSTDWATEIQDFLYNNSKTKKISPLRISSTKPRRTRIPPPHHLAAMKVDMHSDAQEALFRSLFAVQNQVLLESGVPTLLKTKGFTILHSNVRSFSPAGDERAYFVYELMMQKRKHPRRTEYWAVAIDSETLKPHGVVKLDMRKVDRFEQLSILNSGFVTLQNQRISKLSFKEISVSTCTNVIKNSDSPL